MEALIPIVFFLTVGGVLILRPITKRLGLLIEVLAKERQVRLDRPDDVRFDRLGRVLEQLDARLDRMEERIDFNERLLSPSGERPRARVLRSET
jgi:hypothetical protein